jgi:dipeptidyl aminopeptidase/acylaminoacyl peptidase
METTFIAMKRILRWTFTIVFVVAALFVSGSWVAAYLLTRARPVEIGAPPGDFTCPVESIHFTTNDGETLAGWFVPAEDRVKSIVLLHGKAGNRKQMLPRARFFRKLGYSVLLYDARACGESTGDQITFGYYEKGDVIAAVQFLKERGHRNIACLGVSQGGATILFAAEELPDVKCVICESVYDDMTHAVDRRLRRYTGMPGWLGASLMVPFAEHRLHLSVNDVCPVDHVGKLAYPLFVISGSKDDRAWPEDSRRLFDAAREPKELWMVEGAGHEDLFCQPGYREKVVGFLRCHLD